VAVVGARDDCAADAVDSALDVIGGIGDVSAQSTQAAQVMKEHLFVIVRAAHHGVHVEFGAAVAGAVEIRSAGVAV